jgi:RNA polymerase-interacting CarD/CdnL/TRCF family regulator
MATQYNNELDKKEIINYASLVSSFYLITKEKELSALRLRLLSLVQ